MENYLGNLPDRDPGESLASGVAGDLQNPCGVWFELSQQQAFGLLEASIREQHPDWVCSDGSCPMCVTYEYELVEELEGRMDVGPEEVQIEVRIVGIAPDTR